MKKVYIDLAIVVISIIFIIKFSKLFFVMAAIGAILWFFVFDDSKKKTIENKISNLYKM